MPTTTDLSAILFKISTLFLFHLVDYGLFCF